jgi:hypothetical protein
MNKDFRASIQLQDGKIVDWEIFCRSYDKISPTISGTLHIEAWGTPIQVRGTEMTSYHTYEAIVELEDKGPSVWEFLPTSTTPIIATSCVGIHLGHTIESEALRHLYLLVVREVETGVYERVGFGEMSADDVRTVSDYENGRYGSALMTFWVPLPALRKSWQEFRLR